jgi:hypothetical protein
MDHRRHEAEATFADDGDAEVTTERSRRRVTIVIAGAVVIVGSFLAIVVIEPRTCGMDEFECFASRDIYRYLAGFVSVLLSIVIVITGMAGHD